MDKKISINTLVFLAVRTETLRIAMHHGNWSNENDIVRQAITAISDATKQLDLCGLSLTATAADRLKKRLEKGGEQKSILHADSAHLLQRLIDETAHRNFYYTTRSLGSSVQNPFGAEFSLQFPDLTVDIAEAQRCLWANLGTAAVFHLMRVMERFIKILGKNLKINLDVDRANWSDIANHVEKSLKLLPSTTRVQRAKKEKLAASVAHLNAVRIAWRNPVMHPKAVYSVEEAQQIFDLVKIFSLSMLGSPKKN